LRNISLPCLYNIPFLGYAMPLKLICSPSCSQNLKQDIYIQEGSMSFTCPKRQSNAMRSNARPSCQYVCTAVGQSPIPLPKKDTQTHILGPFPSETNKRDAAVDAMLTKSKLTPQPHPYHTSSTPSHPAQSSTANHRPSEYKSV